MKNLLNAVFIIGLLILINSCREDFSFKPAAPQSLEFSADTIYLDTIFTNIGSATYNLKVYNKTEDDILIDRITLQQGSASKFRLNIDGIPGKSFNEVELLAKDSMYIFVETTIDIQEYVQDATTFLYQDKLSFSTDQLVNLMTLVQDAIFLYPQRNDQGIKETLSFGTDDEGNDIEIEGFFLEDEELVFTNDKPYVIYGYAGVPSGKTAIFEAGARIHFHANSGLIAASDASVIVNGMPSNNLETMENEVIFEGDRLEPFFKDIPGQWGTIWLTQGSTGHVFNHATIKNAAVGILMDYNDESSNPTLTIHNSQIHNSSSLGLWGKNAYIKASNSIFGNSGQASFYGNIGGRYEFTHCTFANYWNAGYRSIPAVILDDNLQISENEYFIRPLIQADFKNCIIDGNSALEFFVSQQGTDPLQFNLDHTAIKFNSTNSDILNDPFFDFDDSTLYSTIYQNLQPDFFDPQQQDFRIGEESDFIGLGSMLSAQNIPTDLVGTDRKNTPDLGAFQHIIFDRD